MASNDTGSDFLYLKKGVRLDSEAISQDSSVEVNVELQARFRHLEVFQEPRCLVETAVDDETKKRNLRINEDVLSQIMKIDVPISVVGICGVYGTGKSYLMNRLAGLKGFAVRDTSGSVTKGIWVLCKVHPKHSNQVLVYLDTEGLSEKGDEEHDMKLFCLTMLMSSVLIYNMRGFMNHVALKKLSFITQITKMVSVSGNTVGPEDKAKIAHNVISPDFVLCLRDFYHKSDGLTDDQYMESCLRESEAANKLTKDIQISIKKVFPNRKCFRFPRPAMKSEMLRCLWNVSEEELNEDFRTECQNMTTYIHGLGPKVLNNVTNVHWFGKSFASSLRSYIGDLTKDMKTGFEYAMVKTDEAHNQEPVVKYAKEFKEVIKPPTLPKPRPVSFMRERKKKKDELPPTNSGKQKETNAELKARFAHLKVFQEPRCLVENVIDDETKKSDLRINEDVLSQIIEIDVPISVVGICGVYRSGKSYLMNRLAEAGKGFEGFVLGSTVNAVTKGIWVLCKMHPKHSNQVLVLLDTEGLSDAEKGDEEHDIKLFCLTMLMSSVLIYNMKGVINHEALKKLSFVTEVTKMVTVSGNTVSTEDEEKNALQLISPHFVFCLRDFYYDLDESIKTDDQYMESLLKESDTTNKLTNDIRMSIKGFFPKRKCFAIPMPTSKTESLRRLGNVSEEELNEDFKAKCQKMTTYIHGLGPKVLDNVTNVNWVGKSFASFLHSYIEGLSKGVKMDFGHAMIKAGETHNKELVDKYVQEFKEEKEQEQLPKPRSELFASWMGRMTSLLRELRNKLYPCDLEYYENKAMKKMQKIFDELVSTNSDKQRDVCFEYLLNEYSTMMSEKNIEYETDYNAYEKDFARLLTNYKKKFQTYDEGLYAALRMFEESSTVLEEKANIRMKSELKKMAEENERREKYIQDCMERQRQTIKEEQEAQIQEYEEKLKKYDITLTQVAQMMTQLWENEKERQKMKEEQEAQIQAYKDQLERNDIRQIQFTELMTQLQKIEMERQEMKEKHEAQIQANKHQQAELAQLTYQVKEKENKVEKLKEQKKRLKEEISKKCEVM